MELQLNEDTRKCIESCTKCHSICMQTMHHCLSLGNEHANPEHIQILMDCAQLCQVNADLMLRASDLQSSLSTLCKEACLRCASDCNKISKEDVLMKQCSEICSDCAQTCAKMTKH